MKRTKLKKSKVTAGGVQRNISSLFSSQKHNQELPSSTRPPPPCSPTKTPQSSPYRPLSSPPASPTKRSILGLLGNLLPSSPDLLLSVPETPDSQIRPASSDPGPWDLQASTEAPGLGKSEQHSPLCRSPHSRGASLRTERREDGGRVENREERGREKELKTPASVKRLLSPSYQSHNAKRPRTSCPPATRPAIGPLNKPCHPTDHFLDECLQAIGQSAGSKGQGSKVSLSRANQVVCTHSGEEVTSLKPVTVRGQSPRQSRGLRGEEEECVFTVITDQRTAEERAKRTKLTPHTHAPDTHTPDIHTPNTCSPNTHTPQTANGEGGAAGTAVTSSDRDGTATTSSDRGRGTAVTSPESGEHRATGVTSSDKDCVVVMSSGVTSSECEVEGLEEEWFEEEMDSGTCLVKEEKSNTPCKVPDHVTLCPGVNNRYCVLAVEERPGVKRLTVSCYRTLQPTETCLLSDGWESTPVSHGDVIHLEGRCNAGVWLVDREQGFLVLLPDWLISGTSVSSAIRCMRRAVLGDMFKSFDGGSRQMLNGTLVHEVFQKAAVLKDFSLDTLTQLADQSLASPPNLATMYSVGVSHEEMKREVLEYLPSLSAWADQYLSGPTPRTISLRPGKGAPIRGQDSSGTEVVTVTELVDIEESVWSPRFGLKGKIDVTARVRFLRQGTGRQMEQRILPLELKTGKETNSIEHRSQVILYCMMGVERRGHSEAGFLLYLKTGNLHPVLASHMDRRELIKLRNTLAHHLGNSVEKTAVQSHLSKLPDILTDRQTCQYCPQRINCALYERALENSHPDYISHDAVRDFLLQETGHLTPSHLSYFSHWLLLCCLEAVTMETKNGRKHVWLQTAQEREKSGGCLGNLQLTGPVTVQSEGVFLHRFQRVGVASQQGTSGLADGDRIVVSDQEGRLIGVATGYLCEVSPASVSCTLDRDLTKYSGVVFRCDQDEGVMGLSTHLSNLSRLMDNSPDSGRLRELVVDFRHPQFISSLSSVLPREAKETVANILRGLNKPQKQAMKKVLLSKDYTLIVGMPGTGKTTTICTLVRILYACGFSVLLTSYTHSAVDNILLKLKRFRVGFLRLGRGQKVHPDIYPFTEESLRRRGGGTLCDLEQLYNKEYVAARRADFSSLYKGSFLLMGEGVEIWYPNLEFIPLVVATTCMGIRHALFSRRRFDFCIVDEASQISQPVCLGPLFFAQRFVLVGDHQQLPPIVQNPQARSMGMDESLFKRLEHHSEAVVQLTVQYRMNSQIMSLSNCLMYGGRLECGSERTANALLSLPFLSSVQSELSSLAKNNPQQDLVWIQAALLPSNPVCFLDTSLVPALETVEQGGVSNHTEAHLVHSLLVLLIKAGCKASDVGVIAPYRQQLKLISGLLLSAGLSSVEVNTVDRYQGRDKSLILLSLVRSSTQEGQLGELLKDWRRLNVALTRAKHKLLMLGSTSTLRRYAPLEKLLSHLQQQHMLPPAAHQALPSLHL